MKNDYDIVQELKEEEKQGRLFSSSQESSKNNIYGQNFEHTWFKNFFENAPIFEYMVSPDGKILEINKTALINLGYKKEELIGRFLTIIYASESHEKMKILLAKCLEIGEIDNEEMVTETKQGEKRRVLLSASSIRDNDGVILYFAFVLKDVTEINKMYDDLNKNLWLQNVKLQKLNEIKKTFLKTTSHELRTPITSIKGYVQMLMKKTLGGINEEQRKSLEVILRNTNRLDQIIQNILDASMLESGIMKFVPKQINPRILVEEIIETMKPIANKKEMQINVNLEKNVPNLIIDGERIKQVILNLVDNAIKFSPVGSIINIKVRKEKEEILFEVQDFGQGIPKDKQGMIFESFYQADSGDVRKYGGVGLSLALSKSIVRLHGGNMWFESREGKGSTFLFTLPIQPFYDRGDTKINDEIPSYNTSEENTRLALNFETMNTADEHTSSSITEHEKNTVTSKENEERYRALFNSSFELVYLHDLKGNFIDANPTALKLLGYRKEELNSLNFSSLLESGQIWKAMKTLNEIKHDGRQKKPTEYRLKSKDGTFFDVETTAEIVYRDGTPYAIQGIARDITEQKQAKQILKESEDKYRTLFETTPDLIVETDETGTLLAVNPSMANHFKIPVEKLIGKNIFDILPREIAEERAIIAKKALKDGEIKINEDKRAGRYFYNIYVPIFRPDGRKTIQLIARETTNQKKAEETLQKSEEKYRTLIENTDDQIFLIDEELKVLSLNNSAARAFEKKPEEVIGGSILNLVSKEIINIYAENLKKIFITGEKFKSETKLIKGEIKSWVSVSLTPVKDQYGKVVSVLDVTRDITERKNAEEEIIRLAKFPAENPSPVLRINKDGEVVYSNKAGLEILDFWKTNIGEEIPERWHNIIRKRFSSKNLNAEEEEEVNDKIFSFVISPIQEEGYVNLYGRDITKRKKIEEALRENQEKYQLITENTNDLIIITNFDKTFRYVSPSIKSLGYTPDELIGQDSFVLLHPKDKISITSMLKQLIIGMYKPGTNSRFEYRLRDKSGVYHIYEATARLAKDESGKHVILSISRDITERKKAEEKIKIFSDAIASAFDCIILTDVEGNITYVNESTISAFGYSPEEFLKLHITELDADPIVAKKVMQEIVVKEKWSGEVINIRKNKEKFPAFLSAFIIKDNKSNPIGSMGILRDITERKQAEETLRESEHRLRDIIFSMSDWVWEVDENGVYTWSSQASIDILGRSSKEIIGKTPFDFMSPDEAKRVAAIFSEITAKKAPIKNLENWNVGKNGKKICLLTNGVPILDEKGNLKGYRGVDTDITERKLAEEMLRYNEEKLRKVIDSAPDAITVTDLNGTIIECNQATVEMYGFSTKKEIIGKNVLELVAPKDHENIIKQLKKILETGSIKNLNYTFLKKEGIEFPAEISASVIKDSSGKSTTIIGIIKDITERNHYEEELQRSENRYRTSIELTQLVAWTTSGDGEVIEDIPSWRKYTGESYDAVKGSGWTKSIHPDDLKHTIQMWTMAVKTKSPYETEYRLRRFDGVYRNFLARGIPVLTREGEIKEWVGICIDITNQKKAAEKIKESESQLSNAVKIAHLGPWEYDVVNDIFSFTDSFYAIFHTTAEQVGGYTMSSADYAKRFVHPDDATLVGLEVRKAIEADDPNFSRQVEHRIIYSDGKVGYISVRFFIVKNEKGKTIRTYGVNQDITERKKAEKELKESEEKYRNLVERASDGIVIVQDLVIKYVNSRAYTILGYDPAELIGTSMTNYVHPDELQKLVEYYNRRITGEETPKAYESVLMHKDGRKIDVELSGCAITYQEKPADMIMVHDIARSKKAEKELKEKINQLEQYKNITVNRELKMIEMKKEINVLCKQLNQKPRYDEV